MGLSFGVSLVCNWLVSSYRRLGRSSVLLGGLSVLRVLGGVLGLLGVLFRVSNVRSCVDRAGNVASVTLHRGSGHGADTKATGIGVDGLDIRSPVSEFVLGNIQDLSCVLSVSESGVGISRNNRSVVNEVEQLSCVLGQKNLLLGALNDGSSVNVVSLLELLAGDVGKLSLGDERLSLCADKLLLEGDNLGGAGLLVLQLLNLVGNLDREVSMLDCRVTHRSAYLGLVVARGLNRRLGVANLLEDTSAVFETLCEDILLLSNLGQQDTKLVRNLGDGVVASLLTPVAELRGDVGLLLGCGLVCANGVVLGLDQAVELLGELGLLDTTKTSHGEAVLAG